MKLSESEVQTIIKTVTQEPRTVQEIAQLVDRSWVTTEKYLQEIERQSGIIKLKTFRHGTKAALKVVYATSEHHGVTDAIRQRLENQLLSARQMWDFDFMDLYQFVPAEKKRSYAENAVVEQNEVIDDIILDRPPQYTNFLFSGNLSCLKSQKNGVSAADLMEADLKNNVYTKILCRITPSTLKNLDLITHLLVKYPDLIEVRHSYQPLRGFILDDGFARFRTDEQMSGRMEQTAPSTLRLYYEIYDPEWIIWLKSVFWKMWRSSIVLNDRIREINKVNMNTRSPQSPYRVVQTG